MSYLPGSFYSYQDVTSTPSPIVVANRVAYVCRGISTLNFSLPSSCVAGFSFKVIGITCNWKVVQNAAQSIAYGTLNTNPGVTGSISSTLPTDQIEVTCFTANTNFSVTYQSGNLNVT